MTPEKKQFIKKWSNWWILQKHQSELTEAFKKELDAVSSPLRLVSAIKEIENAMERWNHGRYEDGETLQKINDILVDIGLQFKPLTEDD